MLHTSRLSVELGGHQVLRNVDLTLRSGELVALAGEPGAGKTTLVRCSPAICADIRAAVGLTHERGGRLNGNAQGPRSRPGIVGPW